MTQVNVEHMTTLGQTRLRGGLVEIHLRDLEGVSLVVRAFMGFLNKYSVSSHVAAELEGQVKVLAAVDSKGGCREVST